MIQCALVFEMQKINVDVWSQLLLVYPLSFIWKRKRRRK